jgi:PAS domain S-box-containing protein
MKVVADKQDRCERSVLDAITPQMGVVPALTREYQTIFKNNGKPMVIIEEDATITLVNAEFEKLSGYTKEEIEGKKSWMEFVARDDRRRVKEYHHLRRSDPILSPRCFEFRFLNRNGKVKNVVLTIGQIPGTNKNMASLMDVTDRKQAEATARVSEGRYKAVFENSRDAIYITTADGTYLDANQAALELFVYDREEMKKVNAGQLYADPADARRFRKEIEEKGFVRDFEVRLLKKNGTVMDCLLTVTAQRGDNGDILEYQGIIRDITERKQAEAALQAGEERFRMLVDEAPFGISIMAPHRTFEYFNPRFTKIFGYTKEDIPDKATWFAKAYPDEEYRKKVFSLWEMDLAEEAKIGEQNPRVFTVRCKNGEDKIIDFRTVYLKDSRQYLAYEDITDRVKAEEALKENEERYRSLVDNIRLGINLIDTDHTIIMVNAAQEKYFKKAAANFVGKKCFHEFEKRNAVCPHCPAVHAMATKKPAEAETVLTANDGTHFHVRIQAFPILAKDGTVTSLIEIAEIITERKETEELLQRERETFATILQNALYGVGLIDKDTHYLYLNPEFTAITGYTLQDIPTGRDWMHKAFPDKEYRCKIIEAWKKDSESAGMISRMFSVVCKDGGIKEIEFRPTLLADGRSIVMLSDITERKQAEEALRTSEQHYRTLFEESLDGICLADAETGIIIDCNRALTDLVCRERAELIGKPQTILHPPQDDREKFSLTFKQHLTDKEGQIIETQLITRTGDIREVEIKANSINFQGRKLLQGVFRDSTERKRAEEALRESEERFRKLVETMRIGLSAVDVKGVITYVNDQMCQMLGYTMDEMIGHPTTDFHDEESRKLQEEMFEKRRKGLKDPTPYEIMWVAKDGHKVNTILTPTPGFSPDGKFTSSFALFTDITERKRMEEQLQQSQQELQTIMDASPVAISWADLHGNIQYINRQHQALFGYTLEEIPTIDEWRRQADQDPVQRAKFAHWQEELVEAHKGGRSFPPREMAVTCKDGSICDVMVFGALAANRSLAFYNDITERKQAEELLQQEKETFFTILQNALYGVALITGDGKHVYINPEFTAITGYTLQDIPTGRDWMHKAYPDKEYRQKVRENWKRDAELGGTRREIRVVCKDGKIREIETGRTPLDNGLSVVMLSDITERKRAQERLQRYAADLERSNEEVKNFAYIVSHDLRVPLVNLKGYSSELRSALQVIGSNFDAALPHLNDEKRSEVAMALHEDVPEALEFITNSVSRMDSFINSILLLSRMGRRDLKPESIDMNAVVQETLANLAHQIQERGITVTTGSLPPVVADRTALEQIIGNILGNAVKYLDAERSGQIEISAATNNGEMIFSIRDNGRGIAQEDMDKVFAPFRRAGKQDTPGEGMGLAYVQTLVRRHGGRIWCESELGKGTVFTFTISNPAAQGARDG